jgi:hypothetical protein
MNVPGSGHAVVEAMRLVLDANLQEWEAWASPGRRGEPGDGVIVFRCLADPGERPRVVRVSGGSPGAEARLRSASRAELRELFEAAHPIA